MALDMAVVKGPTPLKKKTFCRSDYLGFLTRPPSRFPDTEAFGKALESTPELRIKLSIKPPKNSVVGHETLTKQHERWNPNDRIKRGKPSSSS